MLVGTVMAAANFGGLLIRIATCARTCWRTCTKQARVVTVTWEFCDLPTFETYFSAANYLKYFYNVMSDVGPRHSVVMIQYMIVLSRE